MTNLAYARPNTSEIVITEFRVGTVTVRLREPLVLAPVIEDGLLVVDAPELGISSYGYTRDELLSALDDDLRFLWEAYVCEGDGRLDPSAQALKRAWQSRTTTG